MATITVDPGREYCVVLFPCPSRDVPFLKGGVILSNDKDALKGDVVAAAGEAISFISQHYRECNGLFDVEVSENTRRRSDDDPYWFGSKISIHSEPANIDVNSIRNIVKRAEDLIGSVLSFLPE